MAIWTQRATAGNSGSIAAFLNWNFDRVDELLEEVVGCVEQARWGEGQQLQEELKLRLVRHIDLEETVLFPAWELRSGCDAGMTRLWRDEHRRLCDELDRIHDHLISADLVGFDGAHRRFASLLARHHAKEESFLYPAADRLLSLEERLDLIARMRDG